jgi:hypothetical protein
MKAPTPEETRRATKALLLGLGLGVLLLLVGRRRRAVGR